MKTLSYQDIVNIMYGAAFLGSGGGGSLQTGLEMLQAYMDAAEKAKEDVYVTLLSPDEMDDNKYAAVTAIMGAPSQAKPNELLVCPKYAFEELVNVHTQVDKEKIIAYSLAIEMGGGNSYIAILVSLYENIPIIDADCSGRAVPSLEIVLATVNGNQISPAVVADINNNKITIEPEDPHNASYVEKIGRAISESSQVGCALSAWTVNKPAVVKTLPIGTIRLSKKIGEILNDAKISDKYSALCKIPNFFCSQIINCGQLKSYTMIPGSDPGFDTGFLIIEDAGCLYKIDFQNENLIISQLAADAGQDAKKIIMTAPDSICMYSNSENIKFPFGTPLTTADIIGSDKTEIQDLRIACVLVKVSEKWQMQGDDKLNELWKPHFANVYYTGNIIPYPFAANTAAQNTGEN